MESVQLFIEKNHY